MTLFQNEEYAQSGEWSWDLTWDILHRDEWKIVSGRDLNTGCVYYGNFTDTGKLYKLEVMQLIPQ